MNFARLSVPVLLAAAILLPPSPARAAARELWVYCPRNLLVDQQVNDLEQLWRRAAKAGYTHVLLADNVRTCVRILREVNPGGRIYVWSDMFDPHHNAVKRDYYLVRGDLTGSWEGLDQDVIMVPWYFEKRAESLKWFADRGHRQVMAGYYDTDPGQVRGWLDSAGRVKGVLGVMYTTWENRYADLERFAEMATQGE